MEREVNQKLVERSVTRSQNIFTWAAPVMVGWDSGLQLLAKYQ